jgi:hypothetical protein
MTEQRLRQDPDDAGRRATEHELSMIVQALDKLVAQREMLGMFATINLKTGEYVIGRTPMEANDRFQSSFSDVMGFAHVVGEPLYEPLLL